MKKVININFQGRVIPIEESAYDMLKQYVESLRKFFANEEGRDEIINDIEGRIAELFGDSLKKGATCITDDTVNEIINSMGRPEDFEGEEGNVHSQLGGEGASQSTNTGSASTESAPRGRLHRDDNEKILGGVCGGLANYLRIDPTIVRLVFALITFMGGSGILLYILLWIILPSKPLDSVTSTKRLSRLLIVFLASAFIISRSTILLVSLILSSIRSLICKVESGFSLPRKMRRILYCCNVRSSFSKNCFNCSVTQLWVKMRFTTVL